MSQTSVLFDVAGPRTRARHRIYTVISLVVILGLAALLVLRMADRGQFAYDLWEPFLTPDYIRALLVDGLLDDAADGVLLGDPRRGLRHDLRRRQAL